MLLRPDVPGRCDVRLRARLVLRSGRGGRLLGSAPGALVPERVDVALVLAAVGLVRLAVARPVQRGVAVAGLRRDLPGGLAVAVLLRLVGRGLLVRVLVRRARRLDAGRVVARGGGGARRTLVLVLVLPLVR